MGKLMNGWAARRPSNPVLQALRFAAVLAGCAAVLAYGPAARAEQVDDPTGDFLTAFANAHPTATNGDLDAIFASTTFDGTNFHLSARVNGDVGFTEGGLYVWGVDRGEGIDFFQTLPNPTGAGVSFDSFIVVNQNGTGMIVRDFLPGGLDTSAVQLGAGAITISGGRIDVIASLADLPTRGRDALDYGFNFWPRLGGISSNDQIADFAPDARNITAGVPEPATWAMMILGFGFAGSALRRRNTASAV